jgi:ketosteroid isomerase-like protein
MQRTNTTALPNDLSTVLDDVSRALAAMGAGDPAPYAALWHDNADATLFGAWGPIERGHQAVTSTFNWVASRFSDGSLVPEHHVVAHSGDLAYTVGFEQGEVRIDAGAPFTMTIRVTHILRRINGTWGLVHRHADFPPSDQRTPAR